jgi:hypothetical protein
MNLTIALIVNGTLVAGLLAALYLVLRVPFRLELSSEVAPALQAPPEDERELARAA